MTKREKILRAVEEFESGNNLCECCEKPSSYTGVFHPSNSQEFCAPEGKDRVIVYGLCDPNEHSLDEVESKIRAVLQHRLTLS